MPEVARSAARTFELRRFDRLDYATAWQMQRERVARILEGRAVNLFVLLEHPPVYTLGRSGSRTEILDHRIPVVVSDRGGKATYHGPGQSVGYVVRDLRASRYAVREHVGKLEETILRVLAACGVAAMREEGHPGVWVDGAKIAALGVRIREGVAYHGFAINRSPDLAAFRGIVPCGLADRPVTSLAALGRMVDRETLETRIIEALSEIFLIDWIQE